MAVINLPEGFLYTEMDEHIIIMVLKCQIAEMMTLVEPKLYMKHIATDSKCQSMLYVKT